MNEKLIKYLKKKRSELVELLNYNKKNIEDMQKEALFITEQLKELGEE